MGKAQFVSPSEAVNLIFDEAAVCVNGFLMANVPEELFKGVENRFLETGHPKISN